MAFSTVLPTPINLIGLDGQENISGFSGPGFMAVSLAYNEPVLHSKYSSGRYDFSRAAGFHKWELQIKYNQLLCEEFHVVYPFLLRRQEAMQPFYIELPQYSTQGLVNKTVNSGGGWGNNTVVVDSGSDPISPGTVFTASEKLYYVTRVETTTDYQTELGSPGTGKERVHFVPTFQDDITSGILDFTAPRLKVRLTSDLSYSVDPNGLYSLNIAVEEIKI